MELSINQVISSSSKRTLATNSWRSPSNRNSGSKGNIRSSSIDLIVIEYLLMRSDI